MFAVLSVCAHVFMFMCLFTNEYVCMWKPKDTLGCHSSGIIFETGSHTDLELDKYMSLGSSKCWGSACLCFPSDKIKSLCHHVLLSYFPWVLRIKFRSSCLQGKQFTGYLPSFCLYFFYKIFLDFIELFIFLCFPPFLSPLPQPSSVVPILPIYSRDC